ncbi:MAG TPA: OadG family protein [Peptococcaceae bacterium]|mgnify:CR=1 FL=1|jgi:sodium pump decarboxylase gamma subunit|nr:OadG family protein [Clostridia bacterium]HOB81962.1 OadG family protein [Peptococcaceae bacterium]HQD53280.1 OadG family protein [Peptococcaceae bacterium]
MQTLMFGLQIAAIGIGIVFVGLIFLIIVIKCLGKGVEAFTKKTVSADVAMSVPDDQAPVSPVKVEEQEDENELIAVICAAVAWMLQGQGQIVTIRRVKEETTPGWALSGRQETMRLRQIL